VTQQSETTGITIEAGLTAEGQSTLSDPLVQALIVAAAISYVVGRFVIGPRDPQEPRKWWDMRRID